MRTLLSVVCFAWYAHAIGSDFFLRAPGSKYPPAKPGALVCEPLKAVSNGA
jgi:hypothetical protein